MKSITSDHLDNENSGDNTITMAFTPSINIQGLCKRVSSSGEIENVNIFLRITGLGGSSSATTDAVAVTTNPPGQFNGLASFDKVRGLTQSSGLLPLTNPQSLLFGTRLTTFPQS
jgi:hypothetical protein